MLVQELVHPKPAHGVICVALMIVGLSMSATSPLPSADAGLAFALCYCAIQVGLTVRVLALPRGHVLVPTIAHFVGLHLGRVSGSRVGSPKAGAAAASGGSGLSNTIATDSRLCSPVLGRSSRPMTSTAAHLAERNQLFRMIALGDSILATGAPFSQSPHPDCAHVRIAQFVAFAGVVHVVDLFLTPAAATAQRRSSLRHAGPHRRGTSLRSL